MEEFYLRGPFPRRFVCITFRLLAVLSLGALAAWSQITTGSLSGTVTDPAGAVIVGAAIKVTNQATGVSASLVTNEAGVYKAAFLTPGSYTVTIQAPGFPHLRNQGRPPRRFTLVRPHRRRMDHRSVRSLPDRPPPHRRAE